MEVQNVEDWVYITTKCQCHTLHHCHDRSMCQYHPMRRKDDGYWTSIHSSLGIVSSTLNETHTLAYVGDTSHSSPVTSINVLLDIMGFQKRKIRLIIFFSSWLLWASLDIIFFKVGPLRLEQMCMNHYLSIFTYMDVFYSSCLIVDLSESVWFWPDHSLHTLCTFQDIVWQTNVSIISHIYQMDRVAVRIFKNRDVEKKPSTLEKRRQRLKLSSTKSFVYFESHQPSSLETVAIMHHPAIVSMFTARFLLWSARDLAYRDNWTPNW